MPKGYAMAVAQVLLDFVELRDAMGSTYALEALEREARAKGGVYLDVLEVLV